MHTLFLIASMTGGFCGVLSGCLWLCESFRVGEILNKTFGGLGANSSCRAAAQMVVKTCFYDVPRPMTR